MRRKLVFLSCLAVIAVFGAILAPTAGAGRGLLTPGAPLDVDPNPPAETPKLIFVHASVGDQWLSHWLGEELGANNYFVSDYSVHNHPNFPGHDYCAWPTVFGDPQWLDVMLQHNVAEASYTRPMPDPGGENTILMIKPCFTQYPILGNPDDPPCADCDCAQTVSAIKGALVDLLDILAQHPDKFFVLVTAPPQKLDGMTYGENARAIADWMVNEWLVGYETGNVMVFDLFNVLTSNAEGEGDPCQEWDTYPENPESASDIWLETGNHHRVWNGEVQHQQEYDQNYSAYCWSHPGKHATYKMTHEFVPLLNAYYNAWVAGETPEGPAAQAGGPYTGDEGAPITFDGSASTDPAGDPLSYAWDLDDDGVYDDAFQAVVSETWSEPGSHTIGLQITTSGGVTDTDTASVTVNNLPPVVDAGGPYGGYEGTSIALSGSGSDPGGGTVAHAWDLDGDGAHDDAFTPNPTYTWETPGTYTVSLAVTDAQGLVGTDTASVVVNALGSMTVNRFTAEYGDQVTYTLAVLGAGRPMTITDPLPSGLAYVADSAVVSPTIGTLSTPGNEVRWTGELGAYELLELSFVAMVTETEPKSIGNVAYVDSGVRIYEWGVSLIANPYRVFVPFVLSE